MKIYWPIWMKRLASASWILPFGCSSRIFLLCLFTKKFTEENEYLAGESNGISNKAAALEEVLMLWLSNINPACHPYKELFDDAQLKESTAYLEIIDALHDYFENQPFFGPDNQNLVDMLRSPAIAVPDSLKGQLDYIRSRWGDLLGHYLLKLLGSLNMISEEEHPRGLGPGPVTRFQLIPLDRKWRQKGSAWMQTGCRIW